MAEGRSNNGVNTAIPNDEPQPSASNRPPKRRRRWPWAVLSVALILFAAALIWAWPVLQRPKSNRTDFPDYSVVMPYVANAPIPLVYPSQKDIAHFPILWPSRPPAENALMDYLTAIRLCSAANPPPGSRASANPYAGDLDALRAWVQANQAALDAARRASQRDYFGLPVLWMAQGKLANPLLDMNLSGGMRALARLCIDAALLAELEGRPDDASEWYLTCQRMGRHLRGGVLIQDLVGIAVFEMDYGRIERLVANAALSPDALSKIITESDLGPHAVEEVATVLDGEAEYFRACPITEKLRARLPGNWPPLDRRTKARLAVPTEELPGQSEVQRLLTSPQDSLGWRDAPWNWRLRLARLEVRMQALRLRAALELYRRQSGQYPKQLSDLAPGILSSIPNDPYTGKPFAYASDGAGWELRSAGPDGVTGNQIELTHPQLRGDFWGDPAGALNTASPPAPVDFIFISDLDSNLDECAWRCPKAYARWEEMHPDPVEPETPGPPDE